MRVETETVDWVSLHKHTKQEKFNGNEKKSERNDYLVSCPHHHWTENEMKLEKDAFARREKCLRVLVLLNTSCLSFSSFFCCGKSSAGHLHVLEGELWTVANHTSLPNCNFLHLQPLRFALVIHSEVHQKNLIWVNPAMMQVQVLVANLPFHDTRVWLAVTCGAFNYHPGS